MIADDDNVSIDPIENRFRKIFPLTIFAKTAQLYMAAVVPVVLATHVATSLFEGDSNGWAAVLGSGIGLAIGTTVILGGTYAICYVVDSITSTQAKAFGILGGLIFGYGVFHFLFLSSNWENFKDLFERIPVPPPLLLSVLVACMALSTGYTIHVLWCLGRGAVHAWLVTPQERHVLRDTPLNLARSHKVLYRLFAMPVLFQFATRPRARLAVIVLLSILTNIIFFLASIGIARLPADLYEVLGQSFQMCSLMRPTWLDRVPWVGSVPGLECLLTAIDLLPRNLHLFDTQPWIATTLLPLAWMVQRLIRRLVRFSLERLQRVDERQPILFLRAFKDDQVRLRPAKIALMARILELGRGRTTLDQLLLEEATPYGPVVAIGNPSDQNPPYGAARGYFDDKTWQEAVSDLARNARFIVICLDETPGIRWEVEHLLRNRHAAKTLFLLHPRFADTKANAACLAGFDGLLGGALSAATDRSRESPGTSILGFFYADDGSIRTIRSSTFSRFAYLLAARAFMRCADAPAIAV